MDNQQQKALILVDIQKDFVPGGALPAEGGREVVPVANRLMETFDLVVATQDWHPADHLSFASSHEGKEAGDKIELEGLEQILWPDHCVQGSEGAKFVDGLRMGPIKKVFKKGVDQEIDSYSGFYDNRHRRATGLSDYLREREVEEVYIAGLATDVCVKYTALDAIKEGFKTYVVIDGCRGVNLEAGDVDKAIREMKDAGARIVRAEEAEVEVEVEVEAENLDGRHPRASQA
ncbi:MAG: bifunctional nicotinamidase/pyrazinamidase [Phaeodactylibacter sp.]|nr:bifunctional nicotinamidase/pyrazinamidase [Phaeodactylibacter sp.]